MNGLEIYEYFALGLNTKPNATLTNLESEKNNQRDRDRDRDREREREREKSMTKIEERKNINLKAMEVKENNEKILNYSFNKDQISKMINSISIGGSTSPTKDKENLAAYLYLPPKGQNSLDSMAPNQLSKEIEMKANLELVALRDKTKNKINWIMVKDIQIILASCFKAMCSLISNVKLKVTNDKVVIELFYHVLIPDANIFSLFGRIFSPDSSSSILRGQGLAEQRQELAEQRQEKTLPCYAIVGGARFSCVSEGVAANIDEHNLDLEEETLNNLKDEDNKIDNKMVKDKKKVQYIKYNSSEKDKYRRSDNLKKFKLERNKLIRLLQKKKITNSIKLQLLLPRRGTENVFNINKNKNKESNLLNLNLFSLNYLNLIRFKFLAFLLNGIFNRPIVFECIRLHHSDAESNILAQLLLLILKKKNIRSVINKLFYKNKVKDINSMKLRANNWFWSRKINIRKKVNNKFVNTANAQTTHQPKKNYHYQEKEEQHIKLSDYIPVFISGLYIHINGRLMREPIIPRLTTKKFEKGAIATGKISYLDQTNLTHKNRKGSFTLKMTFAQNSI